MRTNGQLSAGIPQVWNGKPCTASWPYRSSSGEIIGHVSRFDDGHGKEIIPFFKRTPGVWKPGAPPVPRPLLGLDLFSSSADTVYVTEGEKAALALRQLGLTVTTSMGGANAANKSDWRPLIQFAKVVLLPDNDQPGLHYADEVIRQLSKLPGSRQVSVAKLPQLPSGGDVVDWIQKRSEGWDGYGQIPSKSLASLSEELLQTISDCAEHVSVRSLDERDSSRGPLPLCPEIRDTEPFPVDALPPILADAVDALRASIQAPDALCAQSVLAAASYVAQTHVDVEIDGRVSPVSNFFVTVGESGERKTAVDAHATWPIRAYERELQPKFELEKARFRNADDSYEKARNQILRSKKDHSVKETELNSLGAPPAPPLVPMLLTGDMTLEGLQKQLIHGWPSLGVFAHEGGTIAGGHALNDDNVLKTVAGFSVFWDGRECARVRAGDGAVILYGRRVSVHLMLQPGVAKLIVDNELLRDQGFLSRCLTAWPKSTAGTRLYREVDLTEDERMKRYGARLLDLLRSPLPLSDGRRNELKPRCLTLDPEAKRVWISFHDEVEQELCDEGAYASIRGFANKIAEHALRLASVLEFVETPEAETIDSNAMKSGIALARWYLNEALRIRDASCVDQDLVLAQKVLTFAHGRAESLLALVDICRNGPKPARKANDARRIMGILVAHGWAKPTGESSHEARQWQIVEGMDE